tara:strand:- start:386 stop:748 length:363 start_codon:yes stop_codon:yes gene_type:complete
MTTRRRKGIFLEVLEPVAVANLRQEDTVLIRSKVEVGFTLCRTPQGGLTRGRVARGTRTSVNIPLGCPPGAKLEGFFHTHPGGVAVPSDLDFKAARKARVSVLCVQNDSQLSCFRLKKSR